MTYFALTENGNVYKKAALLLQTCFGAEGAKVDYSAPRPTFAGAYMGVYDFNISHSGDIAAIAVSDKKIGCDLELFTGREHAAIIERFSAREKAEICGEEDFLLNWTAKEAFIKLNAFTLATHLKRLEYFEGDIYMDGEKQSCPIVHIFLPYGILCLCGDDTLRQRDI